MSFYVFFINRARATADRACLSEDMGGSTLLGLRILLGMLSAQTQGGKCLGARIHYAFSPTVCALCASKLAPSPLLQAGQDFIHLLRRKTRTRSLKTENPYPVCCYSYELDT